MVVFIIVCLVLINGYKIYTAEDRIDMAVSLLLEYGTMAIFAFGLAWLTIMIL